MGQTITQAQADAYLAQDVGTAVGLFQEMKGLKQDYIVGAKTVAELLRA